MLAFERLAREGTPEALHRVAELYRGDLLEGLGMTEAPFEEWLVGERERLRELALAALARLLAHQLQGSQDDAAQQTALKLVALDPLQEVVHRTLMRLFAGRGRRDAALRQYQVCVDTLQRELSVEPEAETRQLYQEILRGRSTPPRPARGAAADLSRPSAAAGGEVQAPSPEAAPLIGREPELARLSAGLAEAFGGRGQVIAVLGEAGIGKTRLVAELILEAGRRGGRVLAGHAYATEQALAYGLWIDAVKASGVLDDDDVREDVGPVWCAELARLFPQVATARERRTAGAEDHVRLFEAMAQLLERLATPQPLALVLEDAHWADEMSLRLLSVLSRRVTERSILIVVTAREEEVSDAPMLADVLRLPSVARLSLQPLSRGETTALVHSLSPGGRAAGAIDGLAEQIWSASAGNPFMVVETLRALDQGVTPAAPEALPLPERVRELITARLERLSERGGELTRLAAVIDREFEFDLLRRASGLGENEAAGGVEELVRRRVLRSVGERFKLVHDRVREVVYAALLPMRRKLLHRHVAEALETLYAQDLDAHVAAIGQHYREGEVWAKAVTYLRLAGAQAMMRSATREACSYFEQALAALASLPESLSTLEQAFEILLELRSALLSVGDVRQTLARLREAESLAEKLNDDRRRGRVLAFMANLQSLIGEPDEARASGTRAVAIARAGRPGAPPPQHELPRAGALPPGRVRTGGRAGHRQPCGTTARPGLRLFRKRRAAVGLGSLVAHPESRRARQIRRRRRARRRGDSPRRADAARVHDRDGLPRRGHAPAARGRLAGGARTGRARCRRVSVGGRHPQPCPGGRLLRLGARAARRSERGAEPAARR